MLDALGLKTHFKAVGDGIADDFPSIRAWLDKGIETGRPLYIEAGRYGTGGKAIVVNLAGAREDGLTIMGAGRGRSRFELAGVKHDVPFQIICKRDSSDPCKDEFAAFHSEFSRFGIVGRFDGPTLQLGQNGCDGDQYPDALNSFTFDQLNVDNSADNDLNEAIRVNYVLESNFNIKANCHGTPSKRNKGVALKLLHSAFNRYTGSLSNAEIGAEFAGNDSSFSNTFHSIDFEEGVIAVRSTAPHARNNVMLSPHLAYKHGFDCRAGENLLVVAPNEGLRCEDFDDCGQVIGRSKGKLILNGKGLEFSHLLNAQDYPVPSRVPHRRGKGMLAAVR